MSSKSEIIKLVQSKLNSILKSYYQEAPSTTPFPYCVFTLLNQFEDIYGKKSMELQIHLWDKNNDVLNDLQLEEKSEKIIQTLHLLNEPTETTLPTFFVNQVQSVLDVEPKIIRKLIDCEIHFFEK